MSNIVRLTRLRSGNVHNLEGDKILTDEDVILAADRLPEALQRYRIAQRIWTEEAVLNNFSSQLISPTERHDTLSRLLQTPKVQNHLISVNTKIEEESHGSVFVALPLSKQPAVPEVPTSEGEKMCKKPSKRARTSSDAVDEGHTKYRSACSLENKNCNDKYEIMDAQNGKGNTITDTSATSSSTMSTEALTVPDRAKKSKLDENKVLWDEALDKALFDAVSKHKKDGWSAVAKAVGRGVTVIQCQSRWERNVGPVHQGLKTGVAGWFPSEERRLGELVTLHQLPPAWNKTLQCMYDRVDWKTIGAALGRAAASCADKWKSLQHGMMKKGTFTLSEDAYIERRVAEWGDKGPGLWTQLEKEMNRGDSSIQARWARLSVRTVDA